MYKRINVFLSFVSLFSLSKAMIRENHNQFLSFAILDAAEEGDLKTIKDYYKNGGDLNKTDEDGISLLQLAAEYNQYEVVKFLIDTQKVGINYQSPTEGNTALHEAIGSSDIAIVKILVENGASLTITNKGGYQPVELSLQKITEFQEDLKSGENVKEVKKEYKNQKEILLYLSAQEEKAEIDKAYENNLIPVLDVCGLIKEYLDYE